MSSVRANLNEVVFWAHGSNARDLNLGLVVPSMVYHWPANNALTLEKGTWFRVPRDERGIGTHRELAYPGVGGSVRNSAPYMYIGQNGWEGLDAPTFNSVSVGSVGGHGERMVSNKPRGRVVTIPIMNPVDGTGARNRKDQLDAILYGDHPVTITFRFGTTALRRHLIGCHPIGEQTIQRRHTGQWEHRIRLQSQWGYFVSDPVWNPGAYSSYEIQPMIHGIYFANVTAGASQTINWGGTSITYNHPTTWYVWTPSPPFQFLSTLTGHYLQPYDNTHAADGATQTPAFTRTLTPAGNINLVSHKVYGPGAGNPQGETTLIRSVTSTQSGGVPFRLKNYASL